MWVGSGYNVFDVCDAVCPSVHDNCGGMGGEDYLGIGVELAHEGYEPLLPLYVEGNLGLVHEYGVWLAFLDEDCQQNDEHLLLSAGELVGGEMLFVLEHLYFVARTHDLLACVCKKTVYYVVKACLLSCYHAGYALRLGVLGGE